MRTDLEAQCSVNPAHEGSALEDVEICMGSVKKRCRKENGTESGQHHTGSSSIKQENRTYPKLNTLKGTVTAYSKLTVMQLRMKVEH